MTLPTKIVGAKTFNFRYNVYSVGNPHRVQGMDARLVSILIFPQG